MRKFTRWVFQVVFYCCKFMYHFLRIMLVSPVKFLWRRFFHRGDASQPAGVMDGYRYEHFVARYLRGCGFQDVEVTKASGDFGVDVVARKNGAKYAIQCKYYSGPVGREAVQEVVAGAAYYYCTRTMVITNSTFTSAAKALAKANHVNLLEHISP